MKIKLVVPARKPEWDQDFWSLRSLHKFTKRKTGGAPLSLLTIAALTPSEFEVSLVDENTSMVDFDDAVDLVGISFLTDLAPRAYEIAQEYKSRGVTVVMGGVHASMLPEEAIKNCDCVVIGEAENTWVTLLDDFKKGQLKKFYRAEKYPDLDNPPIPRWELIDVGDYGYFSVQAGRGCPNKCEFCSVGNFNGYVYRHKPVESIVNEVKYLQTFDPRKLIFFSDDNLLSKPSFAKELFAALRDLNVNSWWCQVALNRLYDSDLLDLMRDASCKAAFIGLESLSELSLNEWNKGKINKIAEYQEIIDKVHSHGIAIIGSFIIGSDADDISSFGRTVQFIEESNIVFPMINILTPAPGTSLFEKFAELGRITSSDWHKFNGEHVCFKPTKMSADELQIGRNTALKTLYSYDALYRRLRNLWEKGVFLRTDQEKRRLFTKGRLLFSAKSLGLDLKKSKFVLKSLWNRKVTSTSAVSLALSFHDYAKSLYVGKKS